MNTEALMVLFSWIEIFVVACCVVMIIYCAFDALRDVVRGCYWKHEYKHRFDKSPTQSVDAAPVEDGWISVKDKLPEKSGRYIVYGCSKEMKEAMPECVPIWICDYSVKRGEWYSLQYNKTYDFITHWMLISEPPKEDNDAEQ